VLHINHSKSPKVTYGRVADLGSWYGWLNFFRKNLMIDTLKLLCVLAHPDDESLGMGGSLAKYAAVMRRILSELRPLTP
jgi:hypothetical protein